VLLLGEPPDLDQLQAERLDPFKQTVQSRLIWNRAGEDRLDGLDRMTESLECPREHRVTHPALDPDFDIVVW
jgi:hypothetical protein